jgi:hypothetical protein
MNWFCTLSALWLIVFIKTPDLPVEVLWQSRYIGLTALNLHALSSYPQEKKLGLYWFVVCWVNNKRLIWIYKSAHSSTAWDCANMEYKRHMRKISKVGVYTASQCLSWTPTDIKSIQLDRRNKFCILLHSRVTVVNNNSLYITKQLEVRILNVLNTKQW